MAPRSSGLDPVEVVLCRRFPDAVRGPDDWLRVGSPSRTQGWKLHVSATVDSATAILSRTLPVLASAAAAFKVAPSLTFLAALNAGRFGFSQVGKFLTVYPEDDVEAVRLAVALDNGTAGLSGPQVPSDRPLRRGSLVHYRYGSFCPSQVISVLWWTIPAIRAPNGKLVPDIRGPNYTQPCWAADPFRAAGVVSA